MQALPLGTNICGYVITGILGRGGFGVTYKGQDSNSQRDVAIKEYFPQDIAIRQNGLVQSKSPDDVADFQKGKIDFLHEAQTLAMCSHSSIVSVLGFFEQFGTAYIVMEFVAGETLQSVIVNRFKQGMTEAQISGWFTQILDALDTVHKNGLTHRDVKPENILIRPNGNAVLIDFGAAKQTTARNSALTSLTLTHGYAPPEQYSSSAKDIGSWTDIYALGATVFFAMTGGTVPPRAMERVNAISQSPKHEDPFKQMMGKLSESNRYRPHFLSLVQGMLALSPQERLKSVPDVRNFLNKKAKTPQVPLDPVPLPRNFFPIVKKKKSEEQLSPPSTPSANETEMKLLRLIIFLLIVIIICVAAKIILRG